MEAKYSKTASTKSSWHICRFRPMRQEHPYKHHDTTLVIYWTPHVWRYSEKKRKEQWGRTSQKGMMNLLPELWPVVLHFESTSLRWTEAASRYTEERGGSEPTHETKELKMLVCLFSVFLLASLIYSIREAHEPTQQEITAEPSRSCL